MAKEIPWELTQALAKLNAVEVIKKINQDEYGEDTLHKAFNDIHHDLYEGTRNQAPEGDLTKLRGKGNDNENAFYQLRGALISGNNKPKKDGKEAHAFAAFYQKALDPEILPYGNETQLTTQTFLYFVAKSAEHDLDFRRADAHDIEVLREPLAHSKDELAEVFKHLLDRNREPDASLIRDGETPSSWKMPEGRNDPRLPEEPRLLYVLVDASDPRTFEHLLDNHGNPMTVDYLKKEFAARFDVSEASGRADLLNEVKFVLTNEGGLVWYEDFRAHLEAELTINNKLPDKYKDDEGILDIRKVEGQYFEIPDEMVMGRLDNVSKGNPLNEVLTKGEDREPYPQDYFDAPFVFSEKAGRETVYNNRRDMLSGHNLDLDMNLSAADEERKAFNLGIYDDNGNLLHEGHIHQQARRLVDAMTDRVPVIDRDELRELFYTYRLATHPRLGEHFTDYRTIHDIGTELFKAVSDVIIERSEAESEKKGTFESTFGMSGAGKSTVLEKLKNELDLQLIRAGSNPDMGMVEKMHDSGFKIRLDGVMAPIEACLDRALDRYEQKGRMTAPELSAPIGISAMRRVPGYLRNEVVDELAVWDSSGPRGKYKLLAETAVIGSNEFKHFSAKTSAWQGIAEGEEVHVLKLGETEEGRIKVLKVYGDQALDRLAEYLADGRRHIDEKGHTHYRDFDLPHLPVDTGLAPERNIEVHYEKGKTIEIG